MKRLLAAIGAATLVAAVGSSPVRAADLGGFTLLTRAPGIQVIADSADSPAPVHPAFDGTVPETFASLETGPVGHGLADIFWPGPLFGNFGSALALAGAPPQAGQLNDTIRAETFAPQGPKDATYPLPAGAGSKMTSHADNERVESEADLSQVAAAAVGTFGSITSRSVSTTKDGVAISDGVSKISGISLGGGAVTIESVTSTARITSDGSKAMGKGATTVAGLKIAGQAATVDSSGLHLGGQGANPLGQINDALKQLAQTGITAVLAAPIQEYKGAAGSFISGALVFGFKQSGNYVTVSLGGVQAMVDASKGVDSLLETPPPTPAIEQPPAAPASAGSTTPAAPSSGGTSSLTTDASAGTSSSAGSGGSLTSSNLPSSTSGFFGGLTTGIILLGLLVAIALAVGLRRLSSEVLAAKPAACVVERDKK